MRVNPSPSSNQQTSGAGSTRASSGREALIVSIPTVDRDPLAAATEGPESALNKAAHPKQVILYLLRKQSPLTVPPLVQALGITAQAVRRHLSELVSEGLITYQVASGGLGRPQHQYELTAAGLAQFPHHYDEFALTFLQALAEQLGPDQLEAVLHQQWQQKAQAYRRQIGDGSLAERIGRLAALRSQEGYMVDWQATAAAEDRFTFAEYNCAISQVAETFPTVCTHELAMLAAIFPDCHLERTHWMVGNEHRCGYVIQAK